MAVKTFSVGETLTASDTNTYLANSGLVWINTTSFTASTGFNADGVFSSTYRDYVIVFSCQSSGSGNIFTLQFRTSSTTEANYQNVTMNIDNGTISAAKVTGQTWIRIGANDTNAYHASQIQVFSPNVAAPTRMISEFNRNNGTNVENVWGAQTDSTQFTGFRITVGSGNMTGQYSVYGYRLG